MAQFKFIDKLKQRWNISSNWQLLIIFIVFGITGSLSVKLATPVLNFFGIDNSLSPWVFWPLRILIVFPCYQLLLICIGTLLGQFKFFWNFEKKMWGRMLRRSPKSIQE